MDIKFWWYELKHRWKYKLQKYRPKSPLEVYNTIMTFQFGLENYTFKKGKYIRKKDKNVKSKPSQLSGSPQSSSTGTSGDKQPVNPSATVGQAELPQSTSS